MSSGEASVLLGSHFHLTDRKSYGSSAVSVWYLKIFLTRGDFTHTPLEF